MRKLLHRRWRWFIALALLGATLGVAAGIGSYTFIYAKGSSYLTNDPKACANCHIMQDHFSAWTKSSHHAVAGSNDCHTPKDFTAKWITKGINGYNHSKAFTTGKFHEPIQITARNLEITENQCRHCHAAIVAAIDPPHAGGSRMSCVRCHSTVGHAE